MEKINIGFYCSSISWGGLEMNFVRHAQWLSEVGINICIYCVDGSPIREALFKVNIPVTAIKRNKKYLDLKNARKVNKLFKKDKIDIIWITDNRDLSLIHLMKNFFGLKSKTIYRQAMRMGVVKKDFIHTIRFNSIDIWISTLDYMALEVLERTKLKKEKIRVIPLGLDLEEKEHLNIEVERSNFGWPVDKFIIGIIGRVDPHKGQLFVAKQMPKILENNPNVHLAIVGEPTRNEGEEYLIEIQQFIQSNSLEANISIHPFLKEKDKFYQAVDVVVVSSAAETFGMVSIEAMSNECAILGTNTAGTPELLGNGEFGLTYTPENSQEFLDSLNKLFDLELRKSLGEKAKAEAYSKYSKASFIESVLDLIEGL